MKFNIFNVLSEFIAVLTASKKMVFRKKMFCFFLSVFDVLLVNVGHILTKNSQWLCLE